MTDTVASVEPDPRAIEAAWAAGLLKTATEFAEKALASPWQEDTVKLRNLLLATSVGLGLWLVGTRDVGIEPLGKLASAVDPAVFQLLGTAIQAYALWAYKLASGADATVHRLRVLEPYRRMRAELRDIATSLQARQGEIGGVEVRRKEVLRELAERHAREEAVYAKVLRDLKQRMDATPDDLDAEELWWRVTALRERERTAHAEQVKAAWSGVDSDLEFAVLMRARVDRLDDTTSGTWGIAIRRQAASEVERRGALVIGAGVLVWSLAAGAVKYLGWLLA